MQYQGGKKKYGVHIARVIRQLYEPGMTYLEPFCGMASVALKLVDDVDRCILGDAHLDTVLLLRAVANGWDPPGNVSRDEFDVYKYVRSESSAMRAFVGFGCSYGGVWFRSYATGIRRNGNPRNYARVARDSLRRMRPKLENVDEIVCADYRAWNPENCLIYCDPPYRDVHDHVNTIDHDEFIQVANRWSHDNIVLISEYQPYDGWVPIWRKEHPNNLKSKKSNIEHLFIRDPLG